MDMQYYSELAGMHAKARGSQSENPPRSGVWGAGRARSAHMATTSSTETSSSPHIRSLIPARIDRLPWSRFHTRLVTALGVAWILDGLEITIASNVGPDLPLHNTLNLGAGSVADIA